MPTTADMAPTSPGLRADDRGSVSVEYIVVLTLVSLAAVAAMVALGAPLVSTYLAQTAWLIAPIP